MSGSLNFGLIVADGIPAAFLPALELKSSAIFSPKFGMPEKAPVSAPACAF